MRRTGGKYLSRRRPAHGERRALPRVRGGPLDRRRATRRCAGRDAAPSPRRRPRRCSTAAISPRMEIMASMKRSSSVEVLRLGRLDHERAGDGPRHRGRVDAVVDQALGDVLGGDAGGLGQFAQVENALVRHEPAGAAIQHREVILRAAPPRSWPRAPPSAVDSPQAVGAQHRDVRPRDGQDARRAVRRTADRRALALKVAAGAGSPDAPTGRNCTRCSATATGPTPGPPPPCGMAKVLCRFRCETSPPKWPGLARPTKRVEVGAVDVHLAAGLVNRCADLAHVRLIDAVGRRVRDHDGRNLGARASPAWR